MLQVIEFGIINIPVNFYLIYDFRKLSWKCNYSLYTLKMINEFIYEAQKRNVETLPKTVTHPYITSL